LDPVDDENIKQVTATFPAQLRLQKEHSDVSFVCATDKENEGRLSNAVFRMPPEKEYLYQPMTERSSENSIIQKKLDFSRVSNSQYSLIQNSAQRTDYPLTQRE
jgi:hypothetical protein